MEGREAKIIPFPEKKPKKEPEKIVPYETSFDPEIGLDALRYDDDANRVKTGEIRPDEAFSFLEKQSEETQPWPTNNDLRRTLGKKGYNKYTKPQEPIDFSEDEQKQEIA